LTQESSPSASRLWRRRGRAGADDAQHPFGAHQSKPPSRCLGHDPHSLFARGAPRLAWRYCQPRCATVIAGQSGNSTGLQGKYIVFHYRFDPPIACTALRLDFDRTVGGGQPVLFDFQAFGMS